jgi:hypothetical protein
VLRVAAQVGGDLALYAAQALRIDAVTVGHSRVLPTGVQALSDTVTGMHSQTGGVALFTRSGDLTVVANVSVGLDVRAAAVDPAAGQASGVAGTVLLQSAGALQVQGTAQVSTLGGVIDMEALGGALAMASGTGVSSQGGTVRLSASASLALGRVDAGTGMVSLLAHGGAITRVGAGTTDILAGALRLQASGAIGQADAALRTDVKTVSARSAGGDIVLLNSGDLLTEVERGAEGLDLFEQVVDQFLTGADRNRRNVVDGFVGAQLGRLAAGEGQCVDHVGLDLQQAQLEHLKQADRAGADDNRIGFNGTVVGHAAQRSSSGSLPVRSFQSSASGSGALRLVMLFQPGNTARSALSLVMCNWSLGRSSSA